MTRLCQVLVCYRQSEVGVRLEEENRRTVLLVMWNPVLVVSSSRWLRSTHWRIVRELVLNECATGKGDCGGVLQLPPIEPGPQEMIRRFAVDDVPCRAHACEVSI